MCSMTNLKERQGLKEQYNERRICNGPFSTQTKGFVICIGKKMRKTWNTILALTLSLCMCSSICSGMTLDGLGKHSDVNAKKVSYRITNEANNPISMNNKPESPYWFPNELLEWNPTEDENLSLYQGNIPLKERVPKNKLNPVNQTQKKDFQVAALSIMNASTSGNSPHGLNKFDANTFSYWQYVDKLVYWGGSAGEGLIVPPSSDVIDSAHKNGVPVLGTVFFPMAEHGGQIKWLDDFLVKDSNGHFPMVDKLIEAANILGFDGWFINQETQGTYNAPLTKKHAGLMKKFIYEFKKAAKDSLTLFWYDSMTEDGRIQWQNALTDKNSCYLVGKNGEKGADNMFLNFWWSGSSLLANSKQKAELLGINPYDLFAGIDVQANGTATRVDWNSFAKNNVPYTSLGLYCPSWAYFSATNPTDFEQRENRLWVNKKGDPAQTSNVSGSEWHGVSNYAIEKTVIDSLPFVTNFNLGNGYNYFIDGQKVSSADWNNRSMADIMPTYRWSIEQKRTNSLKAGFDYDNAYYGGNSIKLSGTMARNQHSNITLYSSYLPITQDTIATISAMSDHETDLTLVLKLEDGSIKYIKGNNSLNSSWTNTVFDLSPLKGKIITSIGLDFCQKGRTDTVQINIGRLAFTDKSQNNIEPLKTVSVTNSEFDEEGLYAGVMLNWEKCQNADFYEIYKVYQDGSKSFLGSTTASAHYIHGLERENNETVTNLEVIPVSQYLERGEGATVSITWPDISAPKADFRVSKTLAAPGEIIDFTSLCSKNTEKIKWSFEGADITTSNETNPSVSYAKEGIYTVTLVAQNTEGSDTKTINGMIQIRKEAKGTLPTLSKGKTTTASGYVNSNEAPKFAVDGNFNTKWCATGPAPHDITIDLGSEQLISEVYMAHAEKGNESPDMNTMWYTIETSTDGKTFELVSEVKKNTAKETLDTFKPVKARYVKVTAIKPTQGADTAVRIYEIQVRGLYQ